MQSLVRERMFFTEVFSSSCGTVRWMREISSTLPLVDRKGLSSVIQFGGRSAGQSSKIAPFFFANYEGVRQSKGISTQASVPSALARTGQLVGGSVTVDPAAAAYLPFWHLPTPGLPTSGDFGTYSFTAQQIANENLFTTRVDHSISTKDGLAGTYVFDDAPFTLPMG